MKMTRGEILEVREFNREVRARYRNIICDYVAIFMLAGVYTVLPAVLLFQFYTEGFR